MTGLFTIEKGEHYSNNRFPFLFLGRKLERAVYFNPSCRYQTDLTKDQEQVNKLFGFCELFPSLFAQKEKEKKLHHYFSARFGWNCDNIGNLWLHGYVYSNGIRTMKTVCAVPVSEWIKCTIRVEPGFYTFVVEVPDPNFLKDIPQQHSVKIERASKNRRAFGYGLFPYFGGKHPAPQKIEIDLERV